MSKSNKIELKTYFEENFNKLKEFQFLKEFYNQWIKTYDSSYKVEVK